MEPIIEFSKVNFSYNGALVLEEVNLLVHQGAFLSLVGPNGGGKTTILKIILGLLRPDSGIVRVFGNSPLKARARIGYMPQHASLDPLFPVTVMDVVLMGRLGQNRTFGFYSRKDRIAAEEALKRVELHDTRTRSFSELSGGQAQRVLLARALVTGPELLILDEPMAHVDIAVETELHELLKELNRDMTIVLVTHDLGFVSRYVTSVACVNRRVLEHPTCDISGEMIHELYGTHVHMIRHDAITGKERPHD
ncbi:MAG: ABC transporter ATP-binding protein [Desulfomonilia bacterium]|nr:ABC transporter ATP-binding protein [Desulfomonilia bacterium]